MGGSSFCKELVKSRSSCLRVRLWGASAEPGLCTAIGRPRASCDLTTAGRASRKKIPRGFPKRPPADLVLRLTNNNLDWFDTLWLYWKVNFFFFLPPSPPPPPQHKEAPTTCWVPGKYRGSANIITIYFNAVHVTVMLTGGKWEFHLICAKIFKLDHV